MAKRLGAVLVCCCGMAIAAEPGGDGARGNGAPAAAATNTVNLAAAVNSTESSTGVPASAAEPALPPPASATAADPAADPTAAPPEPAGAPQPADASSDRTTLNLLGEVDSESGESRRNENVRLTLIDNNVLKELNQRMGTTATIIKEFNAEQNFFGKEFGGRPSQPLHLRPSRVSGVHGELHWGHNNSLFSARSFFQVGEVQPSRSNDYGFSFGSRLGKNTNLTLNGSQRKLRGQVNGNVLVPAADERTPLTSDPATLAIVKAILGAYPAELPNRTDINPRALNTNAPQNIDNNRLGAVLDHAWNEDHVSASYNLTLQNVEAFQLVNGQNPDTTTKSHRARLTWSRAWTPSTTTDVTAGYDRIGSLIVPEETSIGPFFLFGRILQSIGPSSSFPINRAQNMFRYAARVRHTRGKHLLRAGSEVLRRQVNGFESNNHRGTFQFGRNFGRDPLENLAMGTPSSYRLAIGDAHRGFRNWDMQFFAADDWKVNANLTLNFGLRYQPVTAATEVNGLSDIPYDCDCNNLAPRFGFAYRLSDTWGVIRGAYGIQYGEIFPATFMQARFNPPEILSIDIRAPDLANPLAGLDESDLNPDARSNIRVLDPELASPYSHQYNFSWELKPFNDWTVELGYVGSRSHKLLTAWYLNRARPVEGIEQISRTVNDRRPDPRFFEVLRVLNGSRGYFDAAKATLRIPRWRGLTVDASYWFSKAIDLGSDYTNTAWGRDARRSRAPSEFSVQDQMRGLSNFDQPHAMLWRLNYETPALGGPNSFLRKIFGRWQFSSIVLFKSGTPFSLRAGSDAPGVGNVDGASGDRPNVVDPAVLGRTIDHPDTSTERLPASAFSLMLPTDTGGNIGRNTFRKDGIWNVNAGLSRVFTLGGERSVLFRVESLNFLNHPQFAEPGQSLSENNFAQITNTLNDGRVFKFTLQLRF